MADSHKLSLSSLAVRGIAFEIVIKIWFNFLKYLHKRTHSDTHLVCNELGILTFLSLALDLMIMVNSSFINNHLRKFADIVNLGTNEMKIFVFIHSQIIPFGWNFGFNKISIFAGSFPVLLWW